METPFNSDKIGHGNQAMFARQQGKRNESRPVKKEASGFEYYNFVPKHSNHGRSNTRTFGQDHEPGTMR